MCVWLLWRAHNRARRTINLYCKLLRLIIGSGSAIGAHKKRARACLTSQYWLIFTPITIDKPVARLCVCCWQTVCQYGSYAYARLIAGVSFDGNQYVNWPDFAEEEEKTAYRTAMMDTEKKCVQQISKQCTHVINNLMEIMINDGSLNYPNCIRYSNGAVNRVCIIATALVRFINICVCVYSAHAHTFPQKPGPAYWQCTRQRLLSKSENIALPGNLMPFAGSRTFRLRVLREQPTDRMRMHDNMWCVCERKQTHTRNSYELWELPAHRSAPDRIMLST